MTSSENSCFPYCSRIFAKSKGAACAAGNFSATSYYLNNLPLSFFTFSRYDKGAKQRCGAKLQLFLLFHFFLSSYFFHTEAAGGSCGFCISVRPNFGGLPARRWLPCVGLCPAQRIEINMTAGGSHTATTLSWATPMTEGVYTTDLLQAIVR